MNMIPYCVIIFVNACLGWTTNVGLFTENQHCIKKGTLQWLLE
jgi:hypothetical protein